MSNLTKGLLHLQKNLAAETEKSSKIPETESETQRQVGREGGGRVYDITRNENRIFSSSNSQTICCFYGPDRSATGRRIALFDLL